MNNHNVDLFINRLQKGDKKAFVELIDTYNQRLYGYALSLTNDHTEAQDILQNVFLKTWEKRKKLGIHSSVQNYLFKSVYNEFINQYKKKRSTMILEQKYFQALEKAISIQNEESMDKIMTKISEEIQQLPPKCQQIFILSKKEGLTNIEISEYLNVSKKTVEAQITKAYGLLRERLGKKYEMLLTLFIGTYSKKLRQG